MLVKYKNNRRGDTKSKIKFTFIEEVTILIPNLHVSKVNNY